MSDTPSNRVRLDLPGAKPKVEVDGALGILANLLVDEQRVRPGRHGWLIPLSQGGEGRLIAKGFVPGFQKFRWQGEEVLALGSHVGLAERIVMFVPFLLILMAWFMVPLSLLLFFMSIPVVKNPQMPRPLRIALPLVNTVAVAIAMFAIGSLIATN